MKLLTLQFLTCAIKSCKSKFTLPPSSASANDDNHTDDSTSKSPFPLHPRDASLERTSLPYTPLFVLNILPRLSFPALKITATEFGLVTLLPGSGEGEVWERIQSDEWREMMLARVMGGEAGTLEEKADADADADVSAAEEDVDVEMVTETAAAAGQGQAEGEEEDENERLLKGLHTLLLETEMMEGKLVCGCCGFEYGVKEGVGNFLLPAHLV